MEQDENDYWNPIADQDISVTALSSADADVQYEVMKHWFFQNFEDPVERTPYESAEGGYIYIWGGPYDATEELEAEFGEIVPLEVIERLVSELEDSCQEWTKAESPDDYEDYYTSIILSNSGFYSNFKESVDRIESLLGVSMDQELQQIYFRMIFVNVITALETFLSDAFINKVSADQSLVRKFVETNPDFAKQKFTLKELFQRSDSIKADVEKYLLAQIWHNLAQVKPMYESTLGITFPNDLKAIFKAILLRHDIVHRNGKTRDGNEHIITKTEVENLIAKVSGLVEYIEKQFPTAKPDELEF